MDCPESSGHLKDVHADFLLGPVEHRGERHDVAVFELAEAGFGVGLGAVGGDHLGHGPVVAVGEQDPLAEDLGFQGVAGLAVDAATTGAGWLGAGR